MRRLLPYIAVILIYVLTPSAAEITENAIHLLTEGHTAHAIVDADHEPAGPEHDCSGPFHVCSCHHTVSFLQAHRPVQVAAPLLVPAGPLWTLDPSLAEGCLGDIFRPPIA